MLARTGLSGGAVDPTQKRRRFELARVGGAIAIPKILDELGADANAVIDAAGLSPEILADSDNVVPFLALGHLLHQCVEATRVEHIGLLLGQNSSTSSLGYLGVLVENSADVRTALGGLVRYFHIHDARGVPILEVSQGTASLGYTIFENSVPGALEIIDSVVASLFNIMRRLCGRSWRPIAVMLPRPRPRSARPFDSFFEVPVRFGAEHGVIVFSTDWLTQSVSDANPLIRRLAEDRIAEIEAETVESFEAQLRPLMRTLVLTRRCSLETVAQLFHLEPRTLARRLEGEAIKFRALVDDARYEVARHLLADTSLAMTQVAEMLDYSEASAFTRAFRRWSGKTPIAWRAERLLHEHKAESRSD
ncbi:Helix-turn-helix domain-containing protein [Rhizobiales bacterium GAS113]|nr:Helix-turn-helix domain-containing protein [Rhizobiales bacterium GAS113]